MPLTPGRQRSDRVRGLARTISPASQDSRTRVHRISAAPTPQSLHIAAPVENWQAWTGMAFPEDGQYAFPHGLAPFAVSGGEGDCWES